MFEWQKIIVTKNDNMKTAIEVLNKEKFRIVLVLENKKLIGTVTDGDIRRALVKHMSMETPISKIMCKNPTAVPENFNNEEILSIMKKRGLMQIPVVDKSGCVLELKTIKNFLEIPKHSNPVFLMAGGLGTRMRPLTDDIPKPLLKIGKKPILQTILEQFISAGFNNFFISTHYKAEMVKEYFGDGSKWKVSIKYIHEKEPLGTAGALGLLPKNLPNLPLIMMNCDLLTKIDFTYLLEFHLNHGGEATMCVREYDFQVPYGVVKAVNHKIISIDEKPIHKFFVNAGIYVLSASLIKSINKVIYMDMPNFLEKTIKNVGDVNMFPIHEYWIDVGQIHQYNKAKVDLQGLFD